MTTTVTRTLPHDAVSTVEEFRAIKARRMALDVDELVLATHFADLYGRVDEPVHVLPGQQRMLGFGGDGTPQVAESCTLELAAALNLRDVTVKSLIADALDLRHRLPNVWNLVLDRRVPVWHGRQIASATRVLDAHAAGLVDLQLARQVVGMTLKRVQELVDGLVLAHLPVEEAEERRQSALDSRGVWISQMADGIASVDAVLDAPDGLRLEAAVEKMSQVLAAGGAPGGRDARRAQALGLLASPARALNLLQADLLDELPMDHFAAKKTLDELGGRGGVLLGDRPSVRCPGEPGTAAEPVEAQVPENCGTAAEPVEAPLAQILRDAQLINLPPLTSAQLAALEPKADLVIHLSDETLATGTGAARAPKLQPVLAEWLDRLLPGHHITVRPVIDTNHQAPSDSYECPPTMREAIEYRNPYEVFPGSTRRSGGLDLDHTIPWRPTGALRQAQHPPVEATSTGGAMPSVVGTVPEPVEGPWASTSSAAMVASGPGLLEAPAAATSEAPFDKLGDRGAAALRDRGSVQLTRPDNLGPLTRKVHRAKTHGGWHLQQPLPGHFLWQSPLGYRYLVTPSRTIDLGRPDAPLHQLAA